MGIRAFDDWYNDKASLIDDDDLELIKAVCNEKINWTQADLINGMREQSNWIETPMHGEITHQSMRENYLLKQSERDSFSMNLS